MPIKKVKYRLVHYDTKRVSLRKAGGPEEIMIDQPTRDEVFKAWPYPVIPQISERTGPGQLIVPGGTPPWPGPPDPVTNDWDDNIHALYRTCAVLITIAIGDDDPVPSNIRLAVIGSDFFNGRSTVAAGPAVPPPPPLPGLFMARFADFIAGTWTFNMIEHSCEIVVMAHSFVQGGELDVLARNFFYGGVVWDANNNVFVPRARILIDIQGCGANALVTASPVSPDMEVWERLLLAQEG